MIFVVTALVLFAEIMNSAIEALCDEPNNDLPCFQVGHAMLEEHRGKASGSLFIKYVR